MAACQAAPAPAAESIGDEVGQRTITRLTVVHDQFPPDSRMPEMVGPGWPLLLTGLKMLLETGETVDFSSMT